MFLDAPYTQVILDFNQTYWDVVLEFGNLEFQIKL